jgi:hypothetical protein
MPVSPGERRSKREACRDLQPASNRAKATGKNRLFMGQRGYRHEDRDGT